MNYINRYINKLLSWDYIKTIEDKHIVLRNGKNKFVIDPEEGISNFYQDDKLVNQTIIRGPIHIHTTPDRNCGG